VYVYEGTMSFSRRCTASAYLKRESMQGLANIDPRSSPKPLLFLMHGMGSGLDTPVALASQGTRFTSLAAVAPGSSTNLA
jgi:hypothetical protein